MNTVVAIHRYSVRYVYCNCVIDKPFVYIYQLIMDCYAMPMQIVVSKEEIKVGQEIDFTFSNDKLIAHFPSTQEGWRLARHVCTCIGRG